MPALGEASRLGIQAFSDTAMVELRPVHSDGDMQAVIRSAYRQVLGNEHVMQSERLISAESLLRDGMLTVREFVRAIAQSELYRKKFFYANSQVRCIELNFKHLLGRAPYAESEITEHVNLYTSKGYEADIDSYIDSLEYQQNFGDNIVPYYRDFQTTVVGQRTIGFTRMFQLYRGYASSDRAQGKTVGQLTTDLARNLASPITPPSAGSLTGTSTGARGGNTYRIRFQQAASPRATVVRLSTSEVVVPFEQLSSKLQQLNRKGSKILGVALS
jgi:phycocyanin-associated rod linker protein